MNRKNHFWLGVGALLVVALGLAFLAQQLHPASRYHFWTPYDGYMGTVPVACFMVLWLTASLLVPPRRRRRR